MAFSFAAYIYLELCFYIRGQGKPIEVGMEHILLQRNLSVFPFSTSQLLYDSSSFTGMANTFISNYFLFYTLYYLCMIIIYVTLLKVNTFWSEKGRKWNVVKATTLKSHCDWPLNSKSTLLLQDSLFTLWSTVRKLGQSNFYLIDLLSEKAKTRQNQCSWIIPLIVVF